MLRQLPARLEISFWSVVTRWMSESRLLQNTMIEAYRLQIFVRNNRRMVMRQAAIWSGAGWLIGFILGLLTV